MTYKMNLHPEPFELIKRGIKDVEMRLYDERRKPIKIGDLIEFNNITTGERLLVKVVNLLKYATFVELYKAYPKERLGYEPHEIADPHDMEKYYSKEQIEECGVLAIEIKLIDVSAR